MNTLPELDDAQLARHARHVLLAEIGYEGQQRIQAGHALILGLGGLGSPVALYLAAAGTGRLTLVDDDRVELSNLQRQIAHADADRGRLKAESAAGRCRALNPALRVQTVCVRPDAAALAALVAAADVVLDCSDNFPTRHALNLACRAARRPLVSGAAIRWSGQLAVFDAREPDAPCYRCLYPEADDAVAETCTASGVIAPLVGVIGALQASEALQLLAGHPAALAGRLLRYDALGARLRSARLPRDPDCPVCGRGPA